IGSGQIAGAHEIYQPSPRSRGLTNMKIKEIVEMSTDELLTKRRDLRQERLHLRLQQQSGQLEQPSRLRLLRRDVARIETILSQRAQDQAAGKKVMAEQKNLTTSAQENTAADPSAPNLAQRGTRKTRTGQVISSS